MSQFHGLLTCIGTLAAAMALVAVATSCGSGEPGVAATVVALEQGCLDRWGKGDPMGFVEVAAPQITYIDPYLERRIDGREAFAAYMDSIKGKVFMDGYELLNPTVEAAGDIAVLSYNYVSWGSTDGKEWRSLWNSTEVYRRLPEGWRIVHSHWSRTQPDTAKNLPDSSL
jgi:ketosteroid isomerase-like protein